MRLKIYFFIAIVAIALHSCTKDIDVNLGSVAPELVVEGVINTDTTTHTVYLKKTAEYFANKPSEAVSGATVTLSDGFTVITLAENPNKKGAYITPSNYYGVVGRTYSLKITNVDINGDGTVETYEASSTIPTKYQVDQIGVNKDRSFGSDHWIVNVWMQDPPKEKNYYMIKAYRNDTCVTDSIQLWMFTNDVIFDGFYLTNFRMIRLDDITSQRLKNNDKVTLEVNGITEDYLNFINDCFYEFWGRNPLFGGQPANIRTNIKQTAPAGNEQKAHGFFAAYSTARGSTIYKE